MAYSYYPGATPRGVVVESGEWRVESRGWMCGVWSVECGVWSVEARVWRLGCEMILGRRNKRLPCESKRGGMGTRGGSEINRREASRFCLFLLLLFLAKKQE